MGIPVLIDAEESWVQDAIDGLSRDMMQKFNAHRAIVYNTVQMYRVDRLEFVKSEIELAREGGYHFGVKLVRGAYMEKERERARVMGYPSPIQPTKAACDADYDDAVAYLMEHIDRTAICCGSHNENSNENLAQLMKQKGGTLRWAHLLFAAARDERSHQLHTCESRLQCCEVRSVRPGSGSDSIFGQVRAEENSSITGQTGRELTLLLKELKRRAEAESN